MALIDDLQKEVSETYRKYGDQKALIVGRDTYTGNQIADEVEKGSEFGLDVLTKLLDLTIDLVKRQKLKIEE